MDFKSLLSQLDQLNEAETKKTKTGRIHKGDYGTEHQPEVERDEYGHRIAKAKKDDKKDDEPVVKKGRGRPTKATQTSGEDKKYDFSAFGVTKGKDVKLPKYDKKKTKKHSIKEYLDQMYKPLNEMGITVKPMPGASQIIGANGKPMGTADAATANVIKQASEKGTLKLGGEETMEDSSDAASDKREALAHHIYMLTMSIHTNDTMYGHDDPQDNARLAKLKAEFARLYPGEDAFKIGSAVKDREYQQKRKQWDQDDKDATRSTGIMQKAKNALGGMYEADQPPRDALASPLTMEAKKSKPDANKNGIPDYAEDGKGKNDLKKKKVKEGMEHKLKAAYHAGKAHGLTGGSHCGKNYEDLEEARQYHEGYKCGLDECYGQMPIQGYVGEESGNDVVGTMASYGAEEGQLGEADIEESPFSWAAKNTPKGDKFSVGGKEFVKNDAFAFEALDKQLNALLEDKEVTEGMTVSISKGQQGSPDSVSVSAQDGEADQLLSVIKSAGLGLFGGDEALGQSSPEPMTVDNGGEPSEVGAGGDAIEVVGDHDGMMSLMKKLSGIGGNEQPTQGDQHSHNEETCESCGGMMEEGHACGEGQEMVD